MYNTQLSGEDAEDQNVIHILTTGASSEPAQQATSTASYAGDPLQSDSCNLRRSSFVEKDKPQLRPRTPLL